LKIRINSIIIISIILLSALFIYLKFDLMAGGFDNKINGTSTSKSNKYPRNGNFDWGEIEVISEPVFGQNNNINISWEPRIAIEDDRIYVVWYDKTDYNGADGDFDIFYRYFDGMIWSDIQVISEPIPGKNFNTGISLKPDITVENGKIYVVWYDDTNINGAGTDLDIFFRCNLTGTNWEDIQVISEPVTGNDLNVEYSGWPVIAVENGRIYVVWDDDTNINGAGTDRDIFFRCNLTGFGWEDVQVISEPVEGEDYNIEGSGGPSVAIENGRIYVVWADRNDTNYASSISHDSDIFYRCNLTGFSWEPVQVISEPVFGKDYNVMTSTYPEIVVENNKIYVVWHDENNTNSAGIDYDIFFRCNLTGSDWEDVQVISEPVEGLNYNIRDSISPEIAVENGRIYVVWDDVMNIDNAGEDREIFFKCNFTGYSWEPIQVISEPEQGSNFNIVDSSSPDIVVNLGKSYIVWQDYNNTNSADWDDDIFFRCITDPSPLFLRYPNVIPTVGYTNTYFNFTITYFHYGNTSPREMIVDIRDTEYPMVEMDSADKNYVDGKDYFFNIKNLDIGLHTYQFYTSDNKFSWSTKLMNNPKVFNTRPKIITEDNLTAIEDIYYEVGYNYNDVDLTNIGQFGFWNSDTNADWLKFNTNTAILHGTPNNDDVGEYWVNISIDDSIDSDFTNFTLTVINVNDAPIIITNETNMIDEDEFYEVNYEALDVDTSLNNLTWFMSTNASWLEFDQKSAALSGLPENNDVGKYWVNISVNDGEYIDFSNFTLKVINVNDPPKIITKEIALAYEDNYYEMDFKAEDTDNKQNDLTWTINTNAQWLIIDNINSIINGTPTNDDVGEYWVNLSVTDGEYFDYENLTLKVINTNDPPKIIVKERTKAKVGELFSVQFQAIDIDPLPTIFTWFIQANASDWLLIGPNTGLLIGEPSEKDIGTYWVNISVNDGEGGWDFYNFTIEVQKSPSEEKETSGTSFIFTETFYGLIWIFIIIIILVSIIILYTFRKQKQEVIQVIREQRNEVIQTVKAELLQTVPSHIALPGGTKQITKEVLTAQPTVIDQLPEPEIKALPAPTIKTNEEPVKVVGATPIQQQFQLPKETLTKEQELKLLRERFLKGEVTEETYNKLRTEIEAHIGEEIIKDELEEHSNISE